MSCDILLILIWLIEHYTELVTLTLAFFIDTLLCWSKLDTRVHTIPSKNLWELCRTRSPKSSNQKNVYIYIYWKQCSEWIGWFSSVSTKIVITEKLHNRKTWNIYVVIALWLQSYFLNHYKHHENKFWYKTSFALRCWNLSILSKQSVITIFH